MAEHPSGLLIPSAQPGDPGWPEVKAALRADHAVRLYPGAYVVAGAWDTADHDERLRLCCIAAALAHPGRHLAGRAAAVVRGFPLLRPLEAIDLAHAGRHNAGRVTAGAPGAPPVRLRHVRTARAELVDGVACASAGDVMVDLARADAFDEAVAVGDAFLRRGGCVTDLLTGIVSPGGRVRSHAAMEALAVASPYSESPLESKGKAALHRAGIGGWVQQDMLVRVADDKPLGRVDFWFPAAGVVLELDGRVKYDGEFGEPAAVVHRERRREKLLVNEGVPVVRGGFEELDDGSLLAALGRVLGEAPPGGYGAGRVRGFHRHQPLPKSVRGHWDRA
ncbi:hypothetical protein [Corynebacterium sp. 335C]